jgi:tetratricopeptide (TPR) repeat protein
VKKLIIIPGGKMNKWIIIILAMILVLYGCAANSGSQTQAALPKSEFTSKVAILPLKTLDSPSRYIQKILTVRDLQQVFDQHPNYELLDMAKIAEQFKQSDFDDVDDLQVEDIQEISQNMMADVIIMANISETRAGLYSISMRMYSTRSQELKQISFNVGKEKTARWKALEDSFMKELDGFVSTEVDKIFNIATNYYMAQNYTEAEKSLKTVIGLKPDKKEAYYYLANTYAKLQKNDLAEQYYKKAMELDPENQQLVVTVIEFYETTNQGAKRVALMEQLAEKNQDVELWFAIGNTYAQDNNNAKAKESFRKALAIDKNYTRAIVRLGNMLYDEENYVEAIPLLEQAFDQAPDNEYLGRRLAVSYQKSNRLDQAIARYEGLITSDPSNVQAYLNVVSLYRTQAGETTDQKLASELNQKAIDKMLELKKVDPQNPYLYLNLAAIYLSQGKYNDAETNANQVINLNPELYHAYIINATVQQTRGTEQYNRYIDLDKQAAKAVGKKAESLKKDRDAARASANSMFRRADELLKTARSKTDDEEAITDINNRINRVAQLISQTI